MSKVAQALSRVYESLLPQREDLVFLLSCQGEAELQGIFSFADKVRAEFAGEGILLRAIIEFSNACKNSCLYCGLNAHNQTLPRYRLSRQEILEAASYAASQRIKTVVLQSGEDQGPSVAWLADIIREIKRSFDMAVTLSVGERPRRDYKAWKDAGADRYLLKIETGNRLLYRALHPGGESFENRLRCLRDLFELGYQVGSGNIIGLKGQTIAMIAEDILFFKQHDFDMIGIGPFIPHPQTGLSECVPADVRLVLKTLALARIVTKRAHLPATSALGSLEKDFRPEGLQSGANVVMPNFTPQPYRRMYEIYPHKRCVDEPVGSCAGCLETMAVSIGRSIDYSRGDAILSLDKR
ncbi:MAG TPA: [FeFe] hydrogenase H-cluster radical SAM maturase HydE [Patescibacteria group bacterium]|nr:[FeFe] hydrogenase H-cluster radical SAM maturase HydE [Patescibacteria group bacterium]